MDGCVPDKIPSEHEGARTPAEYKYAPVQTRGSQGLNQEEIRAVCGFNECDHSLE